MHNESRYAILNIQFSMCSYDNRTILTGCVELMWSHHAIDISMTGIQLPWLKYNKCCI